MKHLLLGKVLSWCRPRETWESMFRMMKSFRTLFTGFLLTFGLCFANALFGQAEKWPEGGKIEVKLEVREVDIQGNGEHGSSPYLVGYLIIKNTGNVEVPLESYIKRSNLVLVGYTKAGELGAGEIDAETRLSIVDTSLEPGGTLLWRINVFGFINRAGQMYYLAEDGHLLEWFFAIYRPVGPTGPEYVSPVTTILRRDPQ